MSDGDKHYHDYFGTTSTVLEHNHNYKGCTSYAIPYGTSHIHYYSGYTSIAKNHKHYVNGYTGPAIRTKDGHVHKMDGRTSYDKDHYHNYSNCTSNQIYNWILSFNILTYLFMKRKDKPLSAYLFIHLVLISLPLNLDFKLPTKLNTLCDKL